MSLVLSIYIRIYIIVLMKYISSACLGLINLWWPSESNLSFNTDHPNKPYF